MAKKPEQRRSLIYVGWVYGPGDQSVEWRLRIKFHRYGWFQGERAYLRRTSALKAAERYRDRILHGSATIECEAEPSA